jgi:two-component system response regulator MprA
MFADDPPDVVVLDVGLPDADGRDVARRFGRAAALAARPGEVVRRAALVAAGWPDGAIVHDNTLDAYRARPDGARAARAWPHPTFNVVTDTST